VQHRSLALRSSGQCGPHRVERRRRLLLWLHAGKAVLALLKLVGAFCLCLGQCCQLFDYTAHHNPF
jgi:hypothetical protein